MMLNPKSQIPNPRQYQNHKFNFFKPFLDFEFWSLGFVSKFEIRNSDFHRRRSGFTLIELIIYLAIVSIILVSISYLMLDLLGGQTKNYANQDINQQLRFITNLLTKDVKAAQDIGSISSDTLVLTMIGDDIIYYFDGSNKQLTRQLGSNEALRLGDGQIEVTGSFIDRSYLSRSKNIEVVLNLNFINQQNRIDYNASTTAIFSVELRGRK